MMNIITFMNTSFRLSNSSAVARPFFAGKDDPGADEQRNDNDLQHRGVGEGCHDITGEDIDEGGHKVGAGRFIPCAQSLGGKLREPALKDVGKHQADNERHNGGADVIDHRFPADGADLLDVLHADHAADHREQHDGNHDEFQQIDKDRPDGLDELGSKGRAAGYIYQPQPMPAPMMSAKKIQNASDSFFLPVDIMFTPRITKN